MKLRKEAYKQYSGHVQLGKIPYLKNSHYRILDVTPDGDAPKQYIRAYFYYKNCPKKVNPNNWDGYYAKFGSKSYPHESIIEYLINQLGDALGLKMNETRLVMANGQVRFLSKDFIKRGQRLIHGTEILAEYFEDRQFIDEINQDKKERRKLLTFEVVFDAIKYVYEEDAQDILACLVSLITFDAIIGNNDRHFYNWGVIGDTTKEKNNPVIFAPIYDSARGLLWNSDEENVFEMYNRAKSDSLVIDRYCHKSLPRFSFDNNHKANHFELIAHLAKAERYKNIISSLVTFEKEKLTLLKLYDTASSLLSKERIELMHEILVNRFNKIREVI
jgi:hypothetical protein